MSTHIADPLREVGVEWGRNWHVNHPNSYAGHAPVGLTQAIADAAVEISVECTVKALKLLKNDEVPEPILAAAR